jgi:uncharacterized protein (DUF1800 family)
MNATAIALNRFGLGARPDEPAPADPQRWLLSQLDQYDALPAPWQPVSRTPALVDVWLAQQRAVRQAPEGQRAGIREAYLRKGREEYVAAAGARATSALQTPSPFVERLVHFWSNHFAISVEKPAVLQLAGAYEVDAIRPHVLGRFDQLLLAAVRHPAMLVYLDQAQSVGPDSLAAQRAADRDPQRRRGLNENLAREVLELHTLGARGGYSQADVTEFARALTGWSLAGAAGDRRGAGGRDDAETQPDGFRFRPALHEPGTRTVLGRTHADEGEAQAVAILRDVAVAPATARHIAMKLARHFVADEPPPALVDRLTVAFQSSDGDLPTVYRALIAAPEAWNGGPGKFKTPWDWTLSSLRALGHRELKSTQGAPMLTQLGQPVWRPGSPAGYDDIAASWAAPDALVRRVALAQRFAAQSGSGVDARALAPRLLPGDALSAGTASALARAESGSTAVALLLVSPEFLRR